MNRRTGVRADPALLERLHSDTALRFYLESESAESAVEKLDAAIREESARRGLRNLCVGAGIGLGLLFLSMMAGIGSGAPSPALVAACFTGFGLFALCFGGGVFVAAGRLQRLRSGVSVLRERAAQCIDPRLLGTLLRLAARVERGQGNGSDFERETLTALARVCTRLFRTEGAAIWLDQDERASLASLLDAAVHEHLSTPSRPVFSEEFLVSAVLMASDLDMRECRGAVLELERRARTVRVREVCLAYLHDLRLPVPGVPLS